MRRVTGVVVGLVKSLADPNGEGRIELEFPGLPDSQRSGWAPVATALAGKSRGAFFMPEQGDEALVGFENGDFNHPFILGFLWNGIDRPPETDAKNRVIVTPGRHMLRFEDGDGAKKIILKSSAGHQIVLDDSPGGQSITLTTKGQQTVVLSDADQSITLHGGDRMLVMRGGMVRIS
jgi:uncharacterized protein involved in type VI secretion and phage assembly